MTAKAAFCFIAFQFCCTALIFVARQFCFCSLPGLSVTPFLFHTNFVHTLGIFHWFKIIIIIIILILILILIIIMSVKLSRVRSEANKVRWIALLDGGHTVGSALVSTCTALIRRSRRLHC